MKKQSKNLRRQKAFAWCLLIICMIISLSACGNQGEQADTPNQTQNQQSIVVKGDGIDGDFVCDLEALAKDEAKTFGGLYSVINNWPTKKFYAAKGVSLEAILQEAGVYDSFQTVTVQGADGYACSLTREQLLQQRYYYPGLQEDSKDGAEVVKTIIATKIAEDATDMFAVADCLPTLIFGQSNIAEHNSPAFVESVSEIIVSAQPSPQWEQATVFPEEGNIASGETVKLQHKDLGLVKLFYTLDGTEPTTESAMYNPSTYQPELNVPIPIEKTTTIKVLVTGYGKLDSEIATFTFSV